MASAMKKVNTEEAVRELIRIQKIIEGLKEQSQRLIEEAAHCANMFQADFVIDLRKTVAYLDTQLGEIQTAIKDQSKRYEGYMKKLEGKLLGGIH